MISVSQFRMLVVRPVLSDLGLWSLAAENLLLGTAVQESGLRYLRQFSNGPARGFFQIEPETEADIHINFLAYRPDLMAKANALLASNPSRSEQLATNMAYATAIARFIYYRRPEPLPDASDVTALARYWKRHFNTEEGKGSVPAFILNYKEFIDD